MEKFEQPVSEVEIAEDYAENLEKGGDLNELWKKYHFKGVAPLTESQVAQRLKDTCARYAKMAVFPEKVIRPTPIIADHKKGFGGGEDYFAELRQQQEMADFVWKNKTSKRISPSDTEKRELHNQIALMVVGRVRSGMNDALAHSIANFACELTYNKTIEEFDAEKTAAEHN